MTSIIKLEPLSGAQDLGPPAYLLQVDEFTFLLDCGWDSELDAGYAEALRRRGPSIDAVLLSYADVAHLGALPFLVAQCGLQCPVYATVPVYKMGQMFLYDWFMSQKAQEDFDAFTLDDVDNAFERVQQLKYSQQVSLKGRGHGLQITPLPAGHMIGGTIWKITKMGEEEIVYAVDFNHKKERHLNGCTLEGIGRASLLITDAFNAAYAQAKRKARDEELLTNILQTVRGGGDVLIGMDTAGRVLELGHLLDQLWANQEAGLITYSLVILSYVAYNVVEFAKSQVEWMSEKILKSFEEGRSNPFAFRHLQLCHNLTELNRVRSPKVVLCSTSDMESGFSRELFLEWSANPKNSIIVTSRSHERTLANKLIHMAQTAKTKPGARNISLAIKRRIRLEGAELEEFVRAKKEKEAASARQRLEELAARRVSRLETADDEDDEDDLDVHMDTAQPQRPKEEAEALVEKESHPYDVSYRWELHQRASFFKQSKRTYPIFPFAEEKILWDDYGQIIRPEDYIIAEPAGLGAGAGELKRGEMPGIVEVVAPQGGTDLPSKCITSVTKLEVLARVAFIDFEGRSDGDSVKTLVAGLKPKQLILVHGTTEATAAMAEWARTNKVAEGRVFTPRLGQVVDATTESHIYQVTLTDLLLSHLAFQPIKDAELAWLDARVNFHNPSAHRGISFEESALHPQIKQEAASASASTSSVHAPANQASEPAAVMEGVGEAGTSGQEGASQDVEGEEESEDRTREVDATSRGPNEMEAVEGAGVVAALDTVPFNAIPPHQAVFVNDPKLSDLKQILIGLGFQAEFSAGILYVNNVVSIKRSAAGRFELSGCVGPEFYRIRDIVYQQFAII